MQQHLWVAKSGEQPWCPSLGEQTAHGGDVPHGASGRGWIGGHSHQDASEKCNAPRKLKKQSDFCNTCCNRPDYRSANTHTPLSLGELYVTFLLALAVWLALPPGIRAELMVFCSPAEASEASQVSLTPLTYLPLTEEYSPGKCRLRKDGRCTGQT